MELDAQAVIGSLRQQLANAHYEVALRDARISQLEEALSTPAADFEVVDEEDTDE